MKQVTSTKTAAEAHVALAALENAGIEGMIQGEHMGTLPLGPGSYPSVWVRDEDYAAACELLGVGASATPRADRSATRALMWIAVGMVRAIILTRVLRA